MGELAELGRCCAEILLELVEQIRELSGRLDTVVAELCCELGETRFEAAADLVLQTPPLGRSGFDDPLSRFDGLALPFTYTVDDDGNLSLTPTAETPAGDAFIWSTRTWERVSD